MAIVTKRTTMSLYSDVDDVYSHQVRIVLAEKGVSVEILPATMGDMNPGLLAINPYGTIPTLLDRDLVLYEARIIMEYLDERFPHPPLLPVYPIARAEIRKMMHRIDQDWYSLLQDFDSTDSHIQSEAKRHLLDSLVSLEPIFGDKPYFLNDEFSMLDCALAPLLWRLPKFGIHIPEKAIGLISYMQRVFARDAFQRSLTDTERQSRAA